MEMKWQAVEGEVLRLTEVEAVCLSAVIRRTSERRRAVIYVSGYAYVRRNA